MLIILSNMGVDYFSDVLAKTNLITVYSASRFVSDNFCVNFNGVLVDAQIEVWAR